MVPKISTIKTYTSGEGGKVYIEQPERLLAAACSTLLRKSVYTIYVSTLLHSNEINDSLDRHAFTSSPRKKDGAKRRCVAGSGRQIDPTNLLNAGKNYRPPHGCLIEKW